MTAGCVPVSPDAQRHIEKANLFNVQWIGPNRFVMPLEWTVVAIYYEALHWMSAVTIARHVDQGLPVPDVSRHSFLRQAMREVSINGQPRTHYLDLETLSRRARYETDPANFVENQDVEKAAILYTTVQIWAATELRGRGYTC